jgi:ectoine hydroxylase-related dioxygenase (phytanoyl-CoA dioxygenase family)
MEFTKLADEQRRQFDEEGYLIVRNAIGPDEINALIAASDRVIASDRTENRQRTTDGLYDGFRNCISLDDAYIPLLTNPKTVPLVVQLLGTNIHMVTSHLIYKHPDKPGTPPTTREPGWHRDIAGVSEDLGFAATPRMEMKVAYYLTDLSKPNYGSTLFLPGSNKMSDRPPILPGSVDPEGTIEPLLEPGDAVLFENRTWHAATANLSRHTRKCVMFGYGYRWLKEFDYQNQSDDLVSKLDPVGRQFVGATKKAGDVFRIGDLDWPLKEWCSENGVTARRAAK